MKRYTDMIQKKKMKILTICWLTILLLFMAKLLNCMMNVTNLYFNQSLWKRY